MSHSRRSAFTAGLALAFVAPVAGLAAAEPDAELVRLCAEFDVLEQRATNCIGDHPPGSVAEQATDAKRAKLVARQEELVERIVDLPCNTVAGAFAMGRSLAGYLDPSELEDKNNHDMEGRLLAALMRTITQGQAKPTASASALPVPVSAPAPSPDAALITACAEYVERDKRVLALAKKHANTRSEGPRWAAYIARSQAMGAEHRRQEDEITEMVPRTPEGIRAKALAAKHALAGGGCETTEPMSEENWLAWSLIEDLLRVV